MEMGKKSRAAGKMEMATSKDERQQNRTFLMDRERSAEPSTQTSIGHQKYENHSSVVVNVPQNGFCIPRSNKGRDSETAGPKVTKRTTASDFSSGNHGPKKTKRQSDLCAPIATAAASAVTNFNVALTNSFNQKMAVAARKAIQDHTRHCSIRARKHHQNHTKHPNVGLLHLSSELVAHSLSFLDPPTVYSTLVQPISKEWRTIITSSADIWRILCMIEPLKARFGDEDSQGSSDDSTSWKQSGVPALSSYRLLYTHFVRCMTYLEKIRDDALHGRPPSMIDYGGTIIRTKRRSRKKRRRNKKENMKPSASSSSSSWSSSLPPIGRGNPTGVADDNSSAESCSYQNEKKRPNAGASSAVSNFGIGRRFLGSATDGAKDNVGLPWSCAIYSIVNWMVAFADVEGMQIMCLRALPAILEDDNQRITAQRAGLTGVVLRGMVLFPHSAELSTEAFHTLVLLARPLGGKEGMLFHCSLVSACGIFDRDAKRGTRNGIAVMLDSMKRFEMNEVLQAMSCWSLVNIALAPAQKAVLVKLGGISVVCNAMMRHPFSPEVQFRALFALINLVIPSVNFESEKEEDDDDSGGNEEDREDDGKSWTNERDTLDDHVGHIANLVVVAMKNFCSSESILSRACLVLHNLSLTPEYRVTLLWTPNCYQMLEWCLVNHTGDQVLQQSAAGTLQRLQMTLSNDADLRRRFQSLMQAHHQFSLEQAHREAVELLDQEGRIAISPQTTATARATAGVQND